MQFRFQYSEAIWLLAAIPIFAAMFWLYLRWLKKTERKMGDPVLVRQLISNMSPFFKWLKFIFLLLAFTAGIFAFMNLRRPGDEAAGNKKGIDVLIALDISKSMWATDLSPSRLEAAKQVITRLIDQMPENRIGLVIFAGKAYLQMPLTTDHSAAKLFVAAANPDNIPQQGTAISDALRMSARAFNSKDRKFKSVLLFSDGEDHDLSTPQMLEEIKEQGIMVNTIGVGSPQGSAIIIPGTGEKKTDAQGQPVLSKLNEPELKEIASRTSGVYLRMTDNNDLAQEIINSLSGVKRESLSDISWVNYKSAYAWFAIPMLLLLVAEFFIPEIKKEKTS